MPTISAGVALYVSVAVLNGMLSVSVIVPKVNWEMRESSINSPY